MHRTATPGKTALPNAAHRSKLKNNRPTSRLFVQDATSGGECSGATMCSLCGALGIEGDWTDAATTPLPGALATRRAQRQRRVRVANVVLAQFALDLRDWQGVQYQLSSRTGRTEIVDNLSQVWRAAESVLGRACDPLDPTLVARLERI
jgi:hypothetical protein